MGNCQDCSRKSVAFDKLLENEAKRTHKREKVTVSLLNAVKISSTKIFNNIIGHYIHQTLIDEEYEYIDDILYDLDCYQSNIISISSHHIINNKLNKHKFSFFIIMFQSIFICKSNSLLTQYSLNCF
eukprot:870763_1